MTDISLAPLVAFGALTLTKLIPLAMTAVGAFAVFEIKRFTGFQVSNAFAAEVEKLIADEALVLVKAGAAKLSTVAFHAGSDEVTEVAERIEAALPAQLRKLGWSEDHLATKIAAALNRALAALEAAPPVVVAAPGPRA